MYTSEFKINKCLTLFKEDLFELEKILRGNFLPSNRKEDFEIRVNFKDREFIKYSMEELFRENLPLSNERITIRVIGWSEDRHINRGVDISLFGILRKIRIDGEVEVWVKGMQEVLKNFFYKRRTFYSGFKGSISSVSGGIIGVCFVIGFYTFKAGSYVYLGASLLMAILLLISSNHKNINKIFPYVKINYYSKGNKSFDIQLINSILATVIGFLTLVATIVIGILTLR